MTSVDDRDVDNTFESEATRDTTPMVQITLKEYDKLKERLNTPSGHDSYDRQDRGTGRALRKHIVRLDIE